MHRPLPGIAGLGVIAAGSVAADIDANVRVEEVRAVGGQPFFVNKAQGAHVWDVDGNEYVDYVGTWGPAILGHAPPKIIKAVQAAAEHGTSFGIPNPFELTLARLIW